MGEGRGISHKRAQSNAKGEGEPGARGEEERVQREGERRADARLFVAIFLFPVGAQLHPVAGRHQA